MIRVVRTTDNELFEFPGPVSVKDLLFGFQGFAVFHNNSSSIFRKKQLLQPLHPDTLLNFTQLYYLKPLLNPSLVTSPLLNHDHAHNPLLGKHTSIIKLWVKQTLIKPLIHKNDEHLLLDNQLLMSPTKPSIHGIAGDLLASKSHSNSNAQEGALINELADTINAQETSLNEPAVCLLNVQDERAIHGLNPEGCSLALNAHHDTLALNEGLIITNYAQEKPSFDVPIQSPIQNTLKKVRFSDDVSVIPSSSKFADSAATPTMSSSLMGNDIIASKEEVKLQFGRAIGQFDKQSHGYQYSASKEELIPYMRKKEMNGVVRLKVVISKKQLTELLSSSRGASEKESNALMEKMLAPLLSPTSSSHKSDSFHGASSSPSSNWRPSLDHIPEDDPFHELLI